MAAKFEIATAKNGQFVFNLKAGNGEVILTSEMYTTKTAAQNGIASVQKNGGSDDRFERKEAKNGQHYFVLKAANHQVIGKSQMYKSATSMESGIKSVMKNAADAKIEDLT